MLFSIRRTAFAVTTLSCRKMSSNIVVKPILALSDNFMYIVGCPKQEVCALVDPVEPEKALKELSTSFPNWKLQHVLTTHHHWDHAGGNKKFHEMYPSVPILGGDIRIDAISKTVSNGDKINIGNLSVTCMATPCHTSGHICYFVTDGALDHCVFTGDTLFIAGCGKFFEGTAQQMFSALIEKLGSLDKSTKVYCGHEYTINNLKFARHVEPKNAAISQKFEWATKTRSNGEFTVPSSIAEEFETNPFMRVGVESVQKHAGVQDPVKVMAKLREDKDNFKSL